MNTEYINLIAQNPGKYPARMGLTWQESEIQQLLQNVKRGLNFEQIADEHQRTRGSITAKLRELAADYYLNDERSIEDIKKFTGLDDEIIVDAIQRRQYATKLKEEKAKVKADTVKKADVVVKASPQQTTNTEILGELQKIRELLSELVSLQKATIKAEVVPKKIIKIKPRFVEEE